MAQSRRWRSQRRSDVHAVDSGLNAARPDRPGDEYDLTVVPGNHPLARCRFLDEELDFFPAVNIGY